MLDLIVHVLVGFLSALASKIKTILGVLGFTCFILYEVVERISIGDKMYPELLQFMFGYFIGLTIIIYLNRDKIKKRLRRIL